MDPSVNKYGSKLLELCFEYLREETNFVLFSENVYRQRKM